MITKQADLQRLDAPQKATFIYNQARSMLSDRLWRAALGDAADDSNGLEVQSGTDAPPLSLEGMMALLSDRHDRPAAAPGGMSGSEDMIAGGVQISPRPQDADAALPDPGPPPQIGGLGANSRYRAELAQAAQRTGIPAPALAAIVNAEAAKTADGSWQPFSRNTRSSAAGLGQFLSGTWQGMAEMKGSWLNGVARSNGWLDSNGKILAGARSAVLSMRYEANASINTIADYARFNIAGLRRRGIQVGTDLDGIARTAYVGHHLGLADAARYLAGGLDPARAQVLLGAQIGTAKASQQIAQAGNAAAAHRNWFSNYLAQHLQPNRFTV